MKEFVAWWERNPGATPQDLGRAIHGIRGNFSLIMKSAGRILGVVDKIRSYPVFYLRDGSRFGISNSARKLRDVFGLSETDDLSLLEFQAAGYITGRETLYKNLFQLQAGELLLWESPKKELHRYRYFRYYSDILRNEKEDRLIEELDHIHNRIFDDIIREAQGRPIWVPLSGGLDSRLVLCKLKQLGYDNIKAFSYGPEGNYEAKAAEEIAGKIGVSWKKYPISMRETRKFFYSSARREYWEFSDGLSNIPNMQDLHVLSTLTVSRAIEQDCIVVNGQSGDFITGGHIPGTFMDCSPDASLLVYWTIRKHYSLWSNLLTESSLKRLEDKILNLTGLSRGAVVDRQELASLYESWEWQERQCKYVISGQRIYDFFKLGWALPLWDDLLLEYWSRIPLNMKLQQGLYTKYLDRFDFYGCFRHFKPRIWRWPGKSILVVPLARTIGLAFGKKCSDGFYRYLKYIGHYRQGYAPYGVLEYVKKARKIRNPVSLNVETWMVENMGHGLRVQ